MTDKAEKFTIDLQQSRVAQLCFGTKTIRFILECAVCTLSARCLRAVCALSAKCRQRCLHNKRPQTLLALSVPARNSKRRRFRARAEQQGGRVMVARRFRGHGVRVAHRGA